MENLEGLVYVPLVIIIYTIMEFFKKLYANRHEVILSALPEIAAVTGGVICCVIHAVYPDILHVSDMVNAFAIGAVSGFAATGSNQAYKQYKKFKGKE